MSEDPSKSAPQGQDQEKECCPNNEQVDVECKYENNPTCPGDEDGEEVVSSKELEALVVDRRMEIWKLFHSTMDGMIFKLEDAKEKIESAANEKIEEIQAMKTQLVFQIDEFQTQVKEMTEGLVSEMGEVESRCEDVIDMLTYAEEKMKGFLA